LVARDKTLITKERYEEYLKKYFPATDKYLFYSGNSPDQVKAFMDSNSGYNWYDTVFSAPEGDLDHPWYQFFDEDTEMDDAEASSSALASLASGDVLVFGAIEYKTKGSKTFFTQHEIGPLHEGLQSGRIKSLNHMAKDATSTDASKIMAKEDADGNFAWQNGYHEGDKNASGDYGNCEESAKRDLAECDAPKPNPKDRPESPAQPPDPPKGDPKSLQIISEQILCEGGPACDSYSWKFMEGDPGVAVDPCGKPVIPNVELDGNSSGDRFPEGWFSMRFGGYAEDCQYQGLGERRPDGDVGWLHCPERPAIKCVESPEYSSGVRKSCDHWGKGSVAVAHCDWE
jgi:hypothetical protein